ncbi:MAG: MarR family transcriptional regulator [archaeon]|nr:MarR family transcriptional regulator [archaeon]MCP8312963.1 MarR family transcriptional regulator [archaeon]
MSKESLTEKSDNRITVLKEIYQWATKLTSESRTQSYHYYWPDPIKRLLNRLKLVRGNLICLQGLQGSGKSIALIELKWKLEDEVEGNIVHFKWPGSNDPFETIHKVLEDSFHQEYVDYLYNKIRERLSDERIAFKVSKIIGYTQGSKIISQAEWEEFKKIMKFQAEKLEHIFTIGERKELRKRFLIISLADSHTIFIDTRDYSRSDRRIMNSDLMAIQSLWDNLVQECLSCEGEVPNLVFGFQKELIERKDSFFYGKMDIIELKPLTPQQLIEAYKLNFNEIWPFEEQALLRVARLSRGIFRRFLRYISLCIEEWMAQEDMNKLIDLPLTEKAITNEEVSKDMDLELAALFPKSEEMKRKAIKIISYLTNVKEGLNQKQLAKALNLNEMDCSRLCDKLEEHGYIIRESSKEGKMVKANF